MAARAKKIDSQQFALISKALADPNRLEILQKLGESGQAATCTCIRNWLQLSPATISHHLKELESVGLVQVERRGKFAYISVRRDTLRSYLERLAGI
jgi:ArsR family transcriptional regulator, arsenate/arsenite/antimonite-responsive transcriptional repressor